MRRVRFAAAVPALVTVLALTGCGGGSSGANSQSASAPTSTSRTSPGVPAAPPDKAAATAQIKVAYRSFFGGSPSSAAQYVEDGQTLKKSFGALQKLAQGARITAKVKSVDFLSATSAKVHYALSVGGHPVLASATGEAVKSGDRWVVAKTTFCGLAQLGVGQGKTVPGC